MYLINLFAVKELGTGEDEMIDDLNQYSNWGGIFQNIDLIKI